LYEDAHTSDGKSHQKHSFAPLHAGCAPDCRGDASLRLEVCHSAVSQDPGVGALHPCCDTRVFVLLSLLDHHIGSRHSTVRVLQSVVLLYGWRSVHMNNGQTLFSN
jgi:hypothetical protein